MWLNCGDINLIYIIGNVGLTDRVCTNRSCAFIAAERWTVDWGRIMGRLEITTRAGGVLNIYELPGLADIYVTCDGLNLESSV